MLEGGKLVHTWEFDGQAVALFIGHETSLALFLREKKSLTFVSIEPSVTHSKANTLSIEPPKRFLFGSKNSVLNFEAVSLVLLVRLYADVRVPFHASTSEQ